MRRWQRDRRRSRQGWLRQCLGRTQAVELPAQQDFSLEINSSVARLLQPMMKKVKRMNRKIDTLEAAAIRSERLEIEGYYHYAPCDRSPDCPQSLDINGAICRWFDDILLQLWACLKLCLLRAFMCRG